MKSGSIMFSYINLLLKTLKMRITLLSAGLSVLLMFSVISRSDAQNLFNGKSLEGWEIIDFEGHGAISVEDSCIIIGKGWG